MRIKNKAVESSLGIFLLKRGDGRKYEGSWLNGKQHGKGVFTKASGEQKEGEWFEGKRTQWLDEKKDS